MTYGYGDLRMPLTIFKETIDQLFVQSVMQYLKFGSVGIIFITVHYVSFFNFLHFLLYPL